MLPLAWQAKNWLPLLRGTHNTALHLLPSCRLSAFRVAAMIGLLLPAGADSCARRDISSTAKSDANRPTGAAQIYELTHTSSGCLTYEWRDRRLLLVAAAIRMNNAVSNVSSRDQRSVGVSPVGRIQPSRILYFARPSGRLCWYVVHHCSLLACLDAALLPILPGCLAAALLTSTQMPRCSTAHSWLA